MKYDVFISYSSKDQKIVEGICGYLEARGIRCFVAYRDIPRGVVWARAIVEALDESKMMVVAFSEHFNRSDQVDREIELASEDHKPILTFRLNDTKFEGAKKYYLKNLNWIDAFPSPDEAFADLYDNICKLLGIEKQDASSSDALKSDSSKTTPPTSQRTQIQEDAPKTPTRKTSSSSKGKKKNTLESQLVFDAASGEFKQKSSDEKPSIEEDKEGFINGHEFVDLGLPSGLKWATCNLRASSPEQYGDYFMWGEIEPKMVCDEDNCETFGKDFQWLRKNGYVDKDGHLSKKYDAASHLWGSTWRMPTDEEFDELLENTTPKRTSRKGIKGHIFISKINGKSVFLPASGWQHNLIIGEEGMVGNYWSSTTSDVEKENAYYYYFGSRKFGWCFKKRCWGLTIRPVSE